jgi:pyridoxamine 5'-phosphate oxidase family protein
MADLPDVVRRYLDSQVIGRLATVDDDGRPQVVPVAYVLSPGGTILIRGRDSSRTRKYQHVLKRGYAALVVDDVVSFEPWDMRGVELRGPARVDGESIRIEPDVVRHWGL